MRFKHWLIEQEAKPELPYWYHWKGEENPIPDWAQDIHTYHRGLTKMDHRYPGFLDLNDPEFYEHPDRHVWHTPDGQLGYSIIPHDGDKREISGVYNLGGKKRPGQGKYAVRRGFIQGGNLLHAFEGGDDGFSLPHYYHNAIGAMPTDFYPFDPKLAHPKWNYEKYKTPGLVQLQVPPEAHQDMERWLRMDHSEMSRDEFQDRLNYLKKLKLGSKMEEGKETKKKGISREEYDRLVRNTDDIYFGGAESGPEEVRQMAFEWGVTFEEALVRLREQRK